MAYDMIEKFPRTRSGARLLTDVSLLAGVAMGEGVSVLDVYTRIVDLILVLEEKAKGCHAAKDSDATLAPSGVRIAHMRERFTDSPFGRDVVLSYQDDEGRLIDGYYTLVSTKRREENPEETDGASTDDVSK